MRHVVYSALLTAALAAPAKAQDWIMGQPILAPQQYWTLMDDKDFSEDVGSTASNAALAELLIYTPDPARSKANLAQFVANLRAGDPKGAAEVEAEFASMDMIAVLDAGMKTVGLDKNNMADVYAAWMITMWSAVHGDLSDTPPETAQAVAAQMLLALLDTPAMLALPNADKQQLAELMMVQAALLSSTQQQSANDPGMTAQVAQAARQGALASGIDLDKIQLTEAGFVASGQ